MLPDWPGVRGPLSLRRSLQLLVAVCIVPVMALSTYFAFESYRLYKLQTYAEAQRIASGLVSDVDSEFAAVASGLKVLATSDALKAGDFRRFHKIAEDAVRSQIVYSYVLTDRRGIQIVNTMRPYGSALPTTGTPPQLDRVFSERRTVLTDYFIGPVTGRPAIAMGVPVVDDRDEVTYSLNVGLAPERMSRLLQDQQVPDTWIAALIDSSGTIVGRNRDEEHFVGQKTVPGLYSQLVAHPEGTLETVTKEGTPVITAYAKSKAWGWSVAVGVPKELLEQKLRRSLYTVVGGMIVTLLAAAWVAMSLVRRLTHSIETLNAAARAITSGKPVDLPDLQIAEANAIGHAIVQASQLASEIHFKAYHDSLTGLANRPLFHEFLESSFARARRSGEPFSLLIIDLDKFKSVNDHDGHAIGDLVLQNAAQRIRAEIRAEDLAVRLGGDEFAVLLVKAARSEGLEVARRIVAALAGPYPDCSVRISGSIGLVSWRPDFKDGEEMLVRADKAAYTVKARGGNGALDADAE